jgi:hypothetical protein
MIIQQDHCCSLMQNFISDPRVPINYFPTFREYYFAKKNNKKIILIYHCPWCKIQLPSSLRDEYYSILKQEYDLEISKHATIALNEKVSPDFASDLWWKKRKLYNKP